MTLIELVVGLAILGIIAAVTGLTLRTMASPTPPAELEARIAALRDSALESGRPATAILTSEGLVGAVTAYPDGRVLSELGTIERASGRPRIGSRATP